MKDYFYIKNEKVFLYDHIEIWPSWALTFHDNLCYLWHFEIGNIWFNMSKNLFHFWKYIDYLERISIWNLKNQCYKCIKNKYNYSKDNSEYVY